MGCVTVITNHTVVYVFYVVDVRLLSKDALCNMYCTAKAKGS